MYLKPSNSESHRQNEKCKMYHHHPLTQVYPTCWRYKLTLILDDGYRLTYGGLDYLALHAHLKKSTIYSVGNCVGVGKESDIYVVASPSGKQHILKIHRLGRISFRSIKNSRDYLKHRSSASWMYMSRLSALKEYSFMKVLKANGFNVPEPVAQSRHTVVMELIDAFPLRQIREIREPAELYVDLIEVVLRLASFGLIHGDFNEFNILAREDSTPSQELESKVPAISEVSKPSIFRPVMIDFPQMISIDHINAELYFDRDINCIKRFFERRFNFVSDEPGPFFGDAKKFAGRQNTKRLDIEVEASGFSKKMAKDLEKYRLEVDATEDGSRDEVNPHSSDDSEDSNSCQDIVGDSHLLGPVGPAFSEDSSKDYGGSRMKDTHREANRAM